MRNVWRAAQDAGMRQGHSRIIFGNADGTSLHKAGGLGGNMKKNIYHLTQFLTRHGGSYRQYLHRVRLHDSANFHGSNVTPEDADHVMFHRLRFTIKRRSLNQTLRRNVPPGNLVAEMLRSNNGELAYGSLYNCKNTK